jgi:hypothetical protein
MCSFHYSHKIWISGIRAVYSLSFLVHVPNEVRVQKVGSQLVYLEEKISHMPKRPSMVEKIKDKGQRFLSNCFSRNPSHNRGTQ